MRSEHIYLASKRSAVTYRRANGNAALEAHVAPGGTGNVVADLLSYLGGTWIASAMSDEDREAAEHNPEGLTITFTSDTPIRVHLLKHDSRVFQSVQNILTANILWSSNNYLWDSWRAPTFDETTARVWHDFRRFSQDYADALLAKSEHDDNALYVLHDYQLVHVPRMLRRARPDRPSLLFVHIPWPAADYWRMLPRCMRTDILAGMLGANVVSFFAKRWAVNFLAAVKDCLPESKIDWAEEKVTFEGHTSWVRVMPLGYSPQAMDARNPQVSSELEAWWEGRPVVLHSGRTDPMKNGVRAVKAFVAALGRSPNLRRTRLLVRANPNRLYVDANNEYYTALQETVESANTQLGDEAVRLISENNVNATFGCIKRADVIFINSTIDGQNLTVFESALMNERHAASILSERCGAAEVLGEVCTLINPFDIDEQARALVAALEMTLEERAALARRRREVASQYDLPQWAESQLSALEATMG